MPDYECNCGADIAAVHTLASQALLMAVLEQDDAAVMFLHGIGEHGGHGVLHAMLLWADTYFALAGPPDPDAGLHFLDHATRTEQNVDDVPPPVAWVGRFMAARGHGDHDQTEALLKSLPRDREIHTAIVWALLTSCALNLRAVVGQL